MRHPRITAGLALALVLGVSAISCARELETNFERIRAVWSVMTFSEGLTRIRCPVTLEGRFSGRRIEKQGTTAIGSIDRATAMFANCSERAMVSTFEFLGTTLPWAFFYHSFSGALPNINAIGLEIIEFAFLVTGSFASCLYQATLRSPLRGSLRRNFTTGVITGFQIEPTPAIPQNGMGSGCPMTIRVEGTSGEVIREMGSATEKVRIELI